MFIIHQIIRVRDSAITVMQWNHIQNKFPPSYIKHFRTKHSEVGEVHKIPTSVSRGCKQHYSKRSVVVYFERMQEGRKQEHGSERRRHNGRRRDNERGTNIQNGRRAGIASTYYRQIQTKCADLFICSKCMSLFEDRGHGRELRHGGDTKPEHSHKK